MPHQVGVRSLRRDELVEAAKGPHVYIDVPSQAGGPREEPWIAINRLRGASVLAVVQRYSALFTKDVPDEETRELLRHEDQSEHIRNTLEAAWERYSASANANALHRIATQRLGANANGVAGIQCAVVVAAAPASGPRRSLIEEFGALSRTDLRRDLQWLAPPPLLLPNESAMAFSSAAS